MDASAAVKMSVHDALAAVAKEIASQIPQIVAGAQQDLALEESKGVTEGTQQPIQSSFRTSRVSFIRTEISGGTSLSQTAEDAKLLDPTTGIDEFKDLAVLMAAATQKIEEGVI